MLDIRNQRLDPTSASKDHPEVDEKLQMNIQCYVMIGNVNVALRGVIPDVRYLRKILSFTYLWLDPQTDDEFCRRKEACHILYQKAGQKGVGKRMTSFLVGQIECRIHGRFHPEFPEFPIWT